MDTKQSTKNNLRILQMLILTCSFMFVSVGICDIIVPVSYTETPGEPAGGVSTYNIQDQTGNQLIDGSLGGDLWNADLGNGVAYEWVGWYNKNVEMQFMFSGSPTINTVKIGFNRNEDYGPIYLPSSVSIGGSNFTPISGVDENTRGFVTFTGNWIGASLQINLYPNAGTTSRFIFVDEVQFLGTPTSSGTIPTPEPVTIVLLSLGVFCLVGVRKKINK